MADKPVDKPSKYRPGAMWFLKWTILAFGVFFFGGLAARGLGALEGHAPDPFWHGFLRALLTFSVGGGIAVGAAMLMWWLAGPRSFSWALGVVVLGVALVLIFIWPTPFKHYKARDLSFFVKVNRLTGTVSYYCKVPSQCPREPAPRQGTTW